MTLNLSATISLFAIVTTYVVLALNWRREDAKQRLKQAEELAAIRVKVDTMWQFMLRRAEAEAVVKGAATKNSPTRFTTDALRWMRHLEPDLRSLYSRVGGAHLSDAELALHIERELGQRIVDEVCVPNGLFFGAGLPIALQILRS